MSASDRADVYSRITAEIVSAIETAPANGACLGITTATASRVPATSPHAKATAVSTFWVTPQVAVQVPGPVMADSRDSGPLWWTVRRIDSGGVKKLVSEW